MDLCWTGRRLDVSLQFHEIDLAVTHCLSRFGLSGYSNSGLT